MHKYINVNNLLPIQCYKNIFKIIHAIIGIGTTLYLYITSYVLALNTYIILICTNWTLLNKKLWTFKYFYTIAILLEI